MSHNAQTDVLYPRSAPPYTPPRSGPDRRLGGRRTDRLAHSPDLCTHHLLHQERAAAISSTVAVSNLLALPLPLLLGPLSDRSRTAHRGRKRFLALGYLIASVGLVGLSLSSSLWHSWSAVALISLSYRVISGIGPALANDLIPRESLDRGLGLFNATIWIGAIVGFAGTGQAVQHLGLTPTLIGGAVLPLIAIGLLALVRPAQDAANQW
jgi:MFS family permease